MSGIINCQSQTIETAVDEYFEMLGSNKLTLNHGPVDANIGLKGKGLIFFVNSIDSKSGDYKNFGVLFDDYRDSYTTFGYNDIDPSFGSIVISTFFENIDNDPENEIIVIYESGGRTHYSPNGGYAGIKVNYQTRVFNCNNDGGINFINEYEIIGELLTVNLPIRTGTMIEEELIGREDFIDELKNVLGVTYNADQVKKRITLLKGKGLLGG